MQEIIDGLWISDIDSVRTRPTDRFDVVVSVCQDDVSDNVGCPNPHYPLADSDQDVGQWGGTTDYAVFEKAAVKVWACLEAQREVLVHCHAGQNRSAAVCIAALAVYWNIDFDEAAREVASARPIINPTKQMQNHAKQFIKENT